MAYMATTTTKMRKKSQQFTFQRRSKTADPETTEDADTNGCQTEIEMDAAIALSRLILEIWGLVRTFSLHRLERGAWRTDEKGQRA